MKFYKFQAYEIKIVLISQKVNPEKVNYLTISGFWIPLRSL